MNEKIEAAMKSLSNKVSTADDSLDAMRFSQAVLNMAHAKATLDSNEREKRRG